eukprot:1273266-Prymnesium_polylepis.2
MDGRSKETTLRKINTPTRSANVTGVKPPAAAQAVEASPGWEALDRRSSAIVDGIIILGNVHAHLRRARVGGKQQRSAGLWTQRSAGLWTLRSTLGFGRVHRVTACRRLHSTCLADGQIFLILAKEIRTNR